MRKAASAIGRASAFMPLEAKWKSRSVLAGPGAGNWRMPRSAARILRLLLALPLIGAAPPADRWADRPHGPVYEQVAPMHHTVERRIMPQIEALLEQLLRERRGMTLDGVKVFESGDKFLPGKIAVAMSYRLLDLPPNDPRLDQRLRD